MVTQTWRHTKIDKDKDKVYEILKYGQLKDNKNDRNKGS